MSSCSRLASLPDKLLAAISKQQQQSNLLDLRDAKEFYFNVDEF